MKLPEAINDGFEASGDEETRWHATIVGHIIVNLLIAVPILHFRMSHAGYIWRSQEATIVVSDADIVV